MGTPARSCQAIPAVPTSMRTSPSRIRRAPSHCSWSLAWIHEPAVQANVDAVTTPPAAMVLWWRTVVMVNVT